MAVKARLEGHRVDLDTLMQLFRKGDPHVAIDDEGYYLTSAMLDGLLPDVTKLHEVASTLLRQANGAARLLRTGFRPVSLTLRFSGDTGAGHVVLLAGVSETRSHGLATLTVAGGEQPQVSPPGLEYLELAQKHLDVAEVLNILGKKSASLDLVDLYKVFEIVRDHGSKPGNGKVATLVAKGWVSQADIKAFIAAADRPDISGDRARHARARGRPPPRRLTLSEAQQVILQLVERWRYSL